MADVIFIKDRFNVRKMKHNPEIEGEKVKR